MHLVVREFLCVCELSVRNVRYIFFFFIDSEIVKPVTDSTLRILKAYAPKILSIEVDRLLQEVKKEP